MLFPKKVKYRRPHRPKRDGFATGNFEINFGEFGIQAITRSYITDRQIEAARIAISRHVKRGGKLWINIFPDKALTKKPLETRMGKGKGSPESWVVNVKPGNILFEIAGVSESIAKSALTRAIHKLPVKCKIISRGEDN